MDMHVDQPETQGWEGEGVLVAPDLDGFSSAIVLGTDTVAAAEVALGIGHAQARRRRVAVGDSVGELAPIEALVPTGAGVHGLVDMFAYGVSLGHVATAIDPARNLFVIPSGPAPIDPSELIESRHWERLVSGFHNTEALLLIVARNDSELLTHILPHFDGVVLVGEATAPASARVLAHAQMDGTESAARVTEAERPALALVRTEGPAEEDATGARPSHATHATHTTHTTHTTHPAHPARRAHPARPPRAPFWIAIAAAVLAMVALGWWAVQRQLHLDTSTSAITSAGAVVDRASLDPDGNGVAPQSAGTPGDPATSATAGVASNLVATQPVADPAAEARALSPFGIALEQLTSTTAATTRMERYAARGLPALTYVPIYDTNLRRRVFLVIGGAFNDSADAAALLRSLRREGVLGRSQGHVVNAPFALLVQKGVTPDQESSYLNGYRHKGLPVYTLVQSDGSMNIYAGAFESADAAEPLLKIFHENGEKPSVVQRAGRPRQ